MSGTDDDDVRACLHADGVMGRSRSGGEGRGESRQTVRKRSLLLLSSLKGLASKTSLDDGRLPRRAPRSGERGASEISAEAVKTVHLLLKE